MPQHSEANSFTRKPQPHANHDAKFAFFRKCFKPCPRKPDSSATSGRFNGGIRMGYENLTPALERIKMVAGFLASHGAETKTVFALEDHYRDTPQMVEAVERMKADPGVGRLISENYMTPDYDLDELAKYPPGSLAHTYAKLMRVVGYSAKFYPEREIK